MFKRLLLIIIMLILILGLPGCNLPGAAAPTPFGGMPTPDLTLTAIFSPVAPTPTLAPLVQTATAIGGKTPEQNQAPTNTTAPTQTPLAQAATDTPTPTQTSIVPPATNTPKPTVLLPQPTNTRPAATSTPPSARSAVTVEAVRLNPVPTKIDGDLSDWYLKHNDTGNTVFGTISSKADLGVTYMAGWDGNYLYLGVFVRDNAYVQNATGKNLYKGDSLDILFDANLRSDYYRTSLSTDDFQLGISPGNPTVGNKPEAYLWYPTGERGNVSDVKIGAMATTRGYDVEVAIPWSLFGVKPKQGQTYGFCFSVSDDDAANTTKQEAMISNCKNRNLTNPTTWGNLTLVTP